MGFLGRPGGEFGDAFFEHGGGEGGVGECGMETGDGWGGGGGEVGFELRCEGVVGGDTTGCRGVAAAVEGALVAGFDHVVDLQ